jgi:hypothetical protein
MRLLRPELFQFRRNARLGQGPVVDWFLIGYLSRIKGESVYTLARHRRTTPAPRPWPPAPPPPRPSRARQRRPPGPHHRGCGPGSFDVFVWNLYFSYTSQVYGNCICVYVCVCKNVTWRIPSSSCSFLMALAKVMGEGASTTRCVSMYMWYW